MIVLVKPLPSGRKWITTAGGDPFKVDDRFTVGVNQAAIR